MQNLAKCPNKVQNAFVAARPPGHHARNYGREEGFCFFNNIAIAAKYLQNVLKYKRILIIDWDYHHGNSTEFFLLISTGSILAVRKLLPALTADFIFTISKPSVRTLYVLSGNLRN